MDPKPPVCTITSRLLTIPPSNDLATIMRKAPGDVSYRDKFFLFYRSGCFAECGCIEPKKDWLLLLYGFFFSPSALIEDGVKCGGIT